MTEFRNEQSTNHIFVIKNSENGEFWCAGSKVAWNLHSGIPGEYKNNCKDKVYFDDQNKYILVKLTKEVFND